MKSLAIFLVCVLGALAVPITNDSSEKKDFGDVVYQMFEEIKERIKCAFKEPNEYLELNKEEHPFLDLPNWK